MRTPRWPAAGLARAAWKLMAITPDERDRTWAAVRRLVDRAPFLKDLRAHRLHLVAAEHWRATGRPVPTALALEELVALHRAAATEATLRTMRAAYDGDLVVLKGPAAGARWPSAHLRPSSDLDVLVARPERLQAALLAHGFRPASSYPDAYYDGLHHLRPLVMPEVPAPIVEVHRRPNWVNWAPTPPIDELLRTTQPATLGVAEVLELRPPAHALALAAHSWGELPLRRLSDLVDMRLLGIEASPDELASLARRWGLSRLWMTNAAVADALFGDAPAPVPLRTWGRNLDAARDAMVFERHIRRWLSPFWVMPPHRAVAGVALAVLHDLTPTPDEGWRDKLLRLREAILHPTRPMDEHRSLLGPRARRARLKRH